MMKRNQLSFTGVDHWSGKKPGMNVSTVFPERYVDNERPQRHVSPIPKEEEGFDLERYRRVKEFVGLEEVTKLDFLLMLFAEVLGTFLLVFIGCASCITWITAKSPSVLHIAFTFGLAVASLAQVLGPISGCHVNPAVSFGLMLSGNCSFLKTVSYIICQCCGAIAGSAVLKLMLPTEIETANSLGSTTLGAGITAGQGVVMEGIITFLLVLVVHAVTDPKRTDVKGWAPLAIGLTISAAHMAAVPLTGSSMNPARTLGPDVVRGEFSNWWVYWVGPLVGGGMAGVVYRMGLRSNREDDEGSYDF
ncbi:aquaporin AQPAn.G-like isoform X2 [Pseudomyrmex gracilis]|uniref:aquaporin AQPAn.G-like isoform X2 n=1 Tax=Pseudomyrmex gracilis TaxID=219809 RepID=UPI0009949624|nr:aquaporin AQPAn.G-like isoform X2 [Pseudomyrmex gracilis]